MKCFPRASLLALSFAVALSACNRPVSDPVDPAATAMAPRAALDSERQRVSYMVGLDLAKQIAPIKGEVDVDTVVQALRTAYAGQPTLLDAAQTDTVRKSFTEYLREKRTAEQQALAAKNLIDGAAFLANNGKNSGIVSTASGLQYQVLREAKGSKPKASDTVKVNYVGTLLDGRKFEDTYAIDHPASFALNQVMPGLAEAMALMPVGATYRFWLPAKLAYGEGGLPGQIEPNATLIFDVELLEIAGQTP